MRDLHIALDVGHSSIGWSVLRLLQPDPGGSAYSTVDILGCGAVTFRADDCLASARRQFRRQRRHIRSTRQRIERMKILLSHLGVLTREELNRPGCAWPWLLAARVLASKTRENPGLLLTWPELWDVLRWYAHNRGYDGNRRWSNSGIDAAADDEDTEKVENARTLMEKHGAKTMAATFCAELKLDPVGEKKSSTVRFKGLNAAFPRDIVEKEVRRILENHIGHLPHVDANLIKALLEDYRALPCDAVKLPRRYQGGLLFGQLVPRFDNRIISKCPITGEKVPARNCPEFLRFRWAMQLANVQVGAFADRDLRPLTRAQRAALDARMRERGYLTAKEFKDQVRSITGCERDNLETMLMHPDAKDALVLDPVQKLVTGDDIAPFWQQLPERLQKKNRGRLRRGKSISLALLREQMLAEGTDVSRFDAAVQHHLDGVGTRGRKKNKPPTPGEFLTRPFSIPPLSGRAAFARRLLARVYSDVMDGRPHPKTEGGCLFQSEQVRLSQLNRAIAEQTNNHLVRHRLLILERLLGDILKEYAAGDKDRVSQLTIEVNRDLQQMSGMTAKAKAQDLGLRIANHHAVAARLDEAFQGQTYNGKPIPITAGLIRKARIAEDLGWTCPYTGQSYEPIDLVTRRVDKDHIIPRSLRPADGLDSLVITFNAVNGMKGKRTACQFIEQEQGKPVPDLPNLSILTMARFRKFVDGLESFKGHDDDKRRKKRRKELLLLPTYEEKEFVPRDLTQTSQLVRMGAQVLRRYFRACAQPPVVISLPGSVTGEVRKAWNVLGCLARACPQVLDESGNVRTKTEIRDITHLHHALDACVLGLASHFIPNNGRIWELIVKRNLSEAERQELGALGVFGVDAEGRFRLCDLSDRLKESIGQRLAEKRVVQHIPARMDGLRVEQNTWRLSVTNGGQATLRQRVRQPDGSRPIKEAEEKTIKLLGLEAGKLQKNKGVLVIPDNFGVALEPQPTIIPFHKVWLRLQELTAANGGKKPRVLRNGQLISIAKGNYKGIWRVFSAKNNTSGMAVNLGAPDVVRLKNKTEGHKINVLLASILKNELRPLHTPLTGISVCPTTSSA